MLDHNKEVLKIQGAINFASVIDIRKAGENKILAYQHVQFNFSQVSHCDSSALSLLIAWKRLAKSREVNIEFLNLPPALISLASMCNVESLIIS